MKTITECPLCGSGEGFYTLTTYVEVPCHIGFDGSPRNNSEMFENASRLHDHRYAYCSSCNKRIGNAKTLDNQVSALISADLQGALVAPHRKGEQ